MDKIDLKRIRDGVEEIHLFSKMGAEKLVSYPYQGLASNYLNKISQNAADISKLLDGETDDEYKQREQFLKQQLSFDFAESQSNAGDSGCAECEGKS